MRRGAGETAGRRREQARREKRHWLKAQGLAFLKTPENVAREEPELVAELIAELIEQEREALVARRKAKGAPLVGA